MIFDKTISISVIGICLGPHPLPTDSLKKEMWVSVTGSQMAKVTAAEEKAAPVTPATAGDEEEELNFSSQWPGPNQGIKG